MNETNIESVGEQQDQVTPEQGNADSTNVTTQPSFNKDDYVHKDRVNEIIQQRTRESSQKAAEKAKAEAESTRTTHNGGMGGMPSIDNEKIAQMVQQEFDRRHQSHKESSERAHHEKKVNDIANDFMSKIEAAKDSYPDLIKRQSEIVDLALLVPFINETSQVAGIAQHLLDNAAAYTNLLLLTQTSPERARREFKKLEESIKQNDEARNREYPNAPLSQPNPSINTMDSGSSSIEALKAQDWLRG